MIRNLGFGIWNLKFKNQDDFFVSQGGIEPPTNGLKGRCSTG
jgi:hypothetical protein